MKNRNEKNFKLVLMLTTFFSFMLVFACVATEAGSARLYLDISFEENFIFDKYDVNLSVDGSLIDTLPHGKHYTKLLEVQEEMHEVCFYKVDDEAVFGMTSVEMTGDTTLLAATLSCAVGQRKKGRGEFL